jgi:hypothetical protein
MRYKIATRPGADFRRIEAGESRSCARCARCGRIFTASRHRRGLCLCDACRRALEAKKGGRRHD